MSNPEAGASINAAVANTYLDGFQSTPDLASVVLGEDRTDSAGIIMAALVRQGDLTRFGAFVGDLATHQREQVNALVHALEYSDSDMLPVLFETINNIDPRTLRFRLKLMAGVTKAQLRELDTYERTVWPDFSVTAEGLLEQTLDEEDVAEMDVRNLFNVSIFTDIPDPENYARDLVMRLGLLIGNDDRDDRLERLASKQSTIARGELYATAALEALHDLGYTDHERLLIDILIDCGRPYYSIIMKHVEKALENDSTDAGELLYEHLNSIDDLSLGFEWLDAMTELGAVHAHYQARTGAADRALEYVNAISDYETRGGVTLQAIHYLIEHGEPARAAVLIEELLDLDPLEVEPYVVSTEEPGASLVARTAEELLAVKARIAGELLPLAAAAGAYDAALKAYNQSSKSDQHAIIKMAEYAESHGNPLLLTRAVIESGELESRHKDRLLAAVLKLFHGRYDQFEAYNVTEAIEREMQTLIHAYATARLDSLSRTERHGDEDRLMIAELLVGCGSYDEGLSLVSDSELLKLKIMRNIAHHAAYQGETEVALQYASALPKSSHAFEREEALSVVVVNSMLLRDKMTAEAAVELYPANLRGLRLARGILMALGDLSCDSMPDWAIDILREDAGVPLIQKAEVIKHAGLVEKRAGDHPNN